MTINTLKIVQREDRTISEVCLAIFQHYEWKDQIHYLNPSRVSGLFLYPLQT